MVISRRLDQAIKDSDGNAQIKGKIRQLQREVAQKRMVQVVPTADAPHRHLQAPPLARALHKHTESGDEISPRLCAALRRCLPTSSRSRLIVRD